MKMYEGWWNAPIKFLPRGVSIAVCDTNEEGQVRRVRLRWVEWAPHLASDGRVDHGEEGRRDLTETDAAHERRGDEPDEVTDDASAEGEDDRVARAAVREEEVFEVGLRLAALGLLSRRDRVRDPPRSVLGGQVGDRLFERGTERGQVELGEVRVGEEDIGRRLEGREDRLDDVRDQVESTVDRLAEGERSDRVSTLGANDGSSEAVGTHLPRIDTLSTCVSVLPCTTEHASFGQRHHEARGLIRKKLGS